MKLKNLILLTFLSQLLNCADAKLEGGAPTKEALVNGFVVALSQGNADSVRSYLVRKKEYIEAIHPHTPEGKNITGQDIWDTTIIRRRDLLTTSLIHKFAKKTCRAEIAGQEKRIEKHGPVTFYREIPVKILCGDTKNLYQESSKSIFGIVVEKNGVFKVLNIFRD